MARFSLVPVLACGLFAVSVVGWTVPDNAGKSEAILSRERRHGPGGCGLQLFEKLHDCCECPHLIPMEAFQGCAAGKAGKNADKIKNNLGSMKAINMSTIRREAFKAMKNIQGGPPCFFECVFKNQSLMASDNTVDMNAVSTKFLAAASDTWRPVVEAAIANCSAVFTQINNMTASPALQGKVMCKPGPFFFMGCIMSYTTLNCPSSVTKNGPSCAANLQKLKNCPILPPPPPGLQG